MLDMVIAERESSTSWAVEKVEFCTQIRRLEAVNESRGRTISEARVATQAAEEAARQHKAEADALKRAASANELRRLGDQDRRQGLAYVVGCMPIEQPNALGVAANNHDGVVS